MTTQESRISEIMEEMDRDPELARMLRERIIGAELPAAVQRNTENIAALTQQVQELTRIVGEILATLQEMAKDISGIQADVRRIDGRLDRGFGTNYEVRVTSAARSILTQKDGIRKARVLKGTGNAFNSEAFEKLADTVETAGENGPLTEEQANSVMMADLIVTGVDRATGQQTYGLAEISITANSNDVQRAKDRAALLALATNIPAVPIVVAAHIPPAVSALAEELGVRVVEYPES